MILNNDYGAFIAPELGVSGSRQGELTGLRFAVKDVFAVAGHSSSAGNPAWLRSHGSSEAHAAAITSLLGAGASLCGAAHTDELMYSLGGENVHYGTPVNPRGAGRIPGGSSSGSAVAVASGAVDFALGTDTGGSVRVPSAYCGVYGFRPTHGAVAMEGVIPLAPGFDTVGWMADSPELLERVGKVLLGAGDGKLEQSEGIRAGGKSLDLDQPVQLSELSRSSGSGCTPADERMSRLYLPADCWALAEPASAACLKRKLGQLQAAADETVENVVSAEGLKSWMDVFRELQAAEIWATHGEWIRLEQPEFGPDIAARFSWAASIAGQDHSRAAALRQEIAGRLRQLLGEDRCLVIPTVPGPAPLVGGDLQQLERNRSGAMMLSCIAGLAGLPQITLPVEGPGGLPLGLSVIGGHGQDLRLLSWVSQAWSRGE
ncbi:amidase [Paenibacillus sp. FSL R7-0273]|uniref:amidase family protein n=1 Tax=Paenibacillus sp. FSL R7-0273 TaxID=1536772 RepID=UPI0004F85A13|nr:amidase family protein [Paenibacillus sp. FSL R7-0273]AIQ45655.1 amidase [Paenibacillus sp. FSL R7-0273]OMF95177.1 amidase [Paenibacillus sp. FSL R7-0273]